MGFGMDFCAKLDDVLFLLFVCNATRLGNDGNDRYHLVSLRS